MYPEELCTPMRLDLTEAGFEEMKTSDEVSAVLDQKEGSVLVMINSVCGCAAGNARPAVKMAAKHSKTPTKLTTVFAGQDKEAVAKVRSIACLIRLHRHQLRCLKMVTWYISSNDTTLVALLP